MPPIAAALGVDDPRRARRAPLFPDASLDRMGCRRIAVLTWLLTGCTPDDDGAPRIPMRSLCGQPEGPIPLLELDVDERVEHVRQAGDRWLLWVKTFDRSILEPIPPDEVPPRVTGVDLRSVDACGDDLQVLLPQVSTVGSSSDEGDAVWIACADAVQRLTWFDPAGQRPPVPLGWCSPYRFVDRDVVLEQDVDGRATVVRLSLQEGHDPMEVWRVDGTWVRAAGPTPPLFARHGASVLEIDPATGATEDVVELEPLEDATVIDGRFVQISIWGEDDFRVYDRETGADLEVDAPVGGDQTGELSSTLRTSGPGYTSLRHAGGSVAVWLPEMIAQPLPDGGLPVGRVGDAMVVIGGEHRRDVHVIDAAGETPRRIAEGVRDLHRVDADSVVVSSEPAHPQALADVLAVPLDGGPATVLARGVLQPQALTGDRWATPLPDDADDSDDAAVLHVLDPDGEPVGVVDAGVALQPWLEWPREVLSPTERIVYSVVAPERYGVWMAELLP